MADDIGRLAERIAARLRERGETVGVAESSAGGLISAALLTIPGASAYFLGGGVIYTQAARRALLERMPVMAVAGPVERVITLETRSDDRARS